MDYLGIIVGAVLIIVGIIIGSALTSVAESRRNK
jgi:hypothetical protein